MTPAPELRWVRRARRGLGAADARPRLGVLGGTFNPVTRAHLALAEAAQRELTLGEVVFVLPATLPHRAPEEASLDERLALLEAALAPQDSFSLAVCSGGLFLEMAAALRPHYAAATTFYFLVGSDAAERILRWDYADPEKALREMFAAFDLIVAGRPGAPALPAEARLARYQAQIHPLALPPDVQAISATAVRERVRAGEPFEELVGPEVATAIRRAGLYRSGR